MSRYSRSLIHYRPIPHFYMRNPANDVRRGDPVIRWFLRIWGGIMIALAASIVIGTAIIVAGGLSG